MEGVPPSSMDDAVNQLEFETFNMSELSWSLPEDDQAGQHMLVDDNVINDTIQQTTRFPPSFPQTMMEGVPPSSMDDDFNQLDVDTLMSELLLSPPEEVPVNQSSMLCNDQAGQNILMGNDVDSIQQTTQFPTPFPDQTMVTTPICYNVHLSQASSNCLLLNKQTTVGGLEGTSSSWINQNWPQTPSSDQQWTYQLPTSNQVPWTLPQPPMNQCSRQFPYQFSQLPITPNPYDPQSSTMLPESSETLRFQNSFIYQGQVDQVPVIPNIDNMQQENLVPRNYDKSTRSQMDNLQVHLLRNQTARPNASNPGPDSSLQTQNRGLNTQQVQRDGLRDPFWNYVEEKGDDSMICMFCQRRWETKIPISRIKWHLSGEEGHGVAICPLVNKEVQEGALKAMRSGNKRHKSTTSSVNVENENIEAGIGRVQREVQVLDTGIEQVHNARDMIRVRTKPVEELVFEKSGRSIVEGMLVGWLGKLDTLEFHVKGLSNFVEYLRSQEGIQSLSTYKISVGTLTRDYWDEFHDFPSKTVMLGNLSINRDRDLWVKFLNGIQGLYCESIDARSLCIFLSLENATELEIIHLLDCDSMENLVSSSWFYSALPPLPSHNGMFSRLKEFSCFGCNSMKKLFPLELLSYLVNLEVIRVKFCEKMEEIIGTTDEESSTSNPIMEVTLPKLTFLILNFLPELKGICSAKLMCNSLQAIVIEYCEKLKRMAICFSLLENGQPSPHPSLKMINAIPKQWWETVVEWEPPNAKEVLRPIVHFG